MFFGYQELLVIAIILGLFGFWIWMLVDCVKHERDGDNRIIWVVIIAVLGFPAALVYLFARKLRRRNAGPPILPSA